MAITVKRKPNRFFPDSKRVIARFYMPGKTDRAKSIIKKVLALSEKNANQILTQILNNFSRRHRNISKIFENSYNEIKELVGEINGNDKPVSLKKKLLIGSYFTMEYSIESTAFFNPSVVEGPDQSNLEEGQKRIIVSFRATGEKHISSIVFRRGVIDKKNNLKFQTPGKLVDVPEVIKRYVYKKSVFLRKLDEMKIHKDIVGMVMDRLKDTFIYGELKRSIEETIKSVKMSHSKSKVIQAIKWLASAHYEVKFSLDTAISERVIFPVSYTEVNGIEDARFVRFTDDNGHVMYYATYTAYDGYSILPKLVKTEDFYHFVVMPIHGEYAQNKGMSLFPRRIDGKYAMISRSDGVNNYIMFSDNINIWEDAKKIQEPEQPWEFIKIGNSGSALETEKGWLLITHGVGPMRQYTLGAILLDLNDPTKVVGRLKEPLLIPNEEEREGYVPNVVYSCGSIIHNNELIIAYGMSDCASGFAGVPLDDLFDHLLPSDSANQKESNGDFIPSILLVDDDSKTRKLVSVLLKDQGYHIESASDGAEALLMIGEKKFDLILSDIKMPNLNGFELLEILNQKKINCPVIFLTAYPSEEQEIKGLELGAIAYIRKPIKRELLLLKVRNYLSKISNNVNNT